MLTSSEATISDSLFLIPISSQQIEISHTLNNFGGNPILIQISDFGISRASESSVTNSSMDGADGKDTLCPPLGPFQLITNDMSLVISKYL